MGAISRSHSVIGVVMVALLLLSCTDADQAQTTLGATWEATIEHETVREAVGLAIVGQVLVVSDPQGGLIHRFSLDPTTRGEMMAGWSSGIERPMHMEADKNGRLFLADYLSDQVLLFARDGSLVMSFGTSGSEEGRFDAPAGVAVGDDGSIYVADFNNHRVQRFDAEGRFVQRWGREGHEPGDFYYPTDVAVGPEGRVYVADAYNHRVQVFTPDGTFVTAWGRQGSGLGEFDVAIGLAVDTQGRVFVADQFNHRIQVFDRRGKWLGSWGEHGSEPGQFDRPSDITFDDAGLIYVADFGNARVQVFTVHQITIDTTREAATWPESRPARSSLGRWWY